MTIKVFKNFAFSTIFLGLAIIFSALIIKEIYNFVDQYYFYDNVTKAFKIIYIAGIVILDLSWYTLFIYFLIKIFKKEIKTE